MGDKITIPSWMLAYIIEPRSIDERRKRLEKVIADCEGEE